jgi:hypothetical protein
MSVFMWFILVLFYFMAILSVLLVSDTIIYPDEIVSSFLGIHLISIKIGSICEIRKTMSYDRWEQEYREILTIRKSGASTRDGLSTLFTTVKIFPSLIGLADLKKYLMDVSAANTIPLTLVDTRLPPVGSGPGAFDSPLRISDL